MRLRGLVLLVLLSACKPKTPGPPVDKASLKIPANHVIVDLRFSRESLHAIDRTGEIVVYDLVTKKETIRLASPGVPDASAPIGRVVKPLAGGTVELRFTSATICLHTLATKVDECIPAPEPILENVPVAISTDERMCAYLGTNTIRVLELPKLR